MYAPELVLLCLLFMMADQIQVGDRVAGKIGELVENPNKTLLPNGKQRRRLRLQATGTVVEAAGLRKWRVRLDHNNKIVTISTAAIKKIEANVGLPMVSDTTV